MHRFAACIDTLERSAPHNGPVSMVTGEVSLALTDGTLDGILPFDFTRFYRTRAVELDSGLGFGWRHSLCQHLEFNGEQVLWIDAENHRTPFPWPTTARPLIRNRLSRAAIYLGEEPGELILAQAGDAARFFHFRDGRLTVISDAYDNRLTVQRDGLERIQRLDNGADRALLLRYDLKHLVAVDYQVFQRCGPEAHTWRTEQTLVSYRYDARQRLVEATNAVGESERYDYDEQHVVLQRQLAGGASFFWAWERSGKTARCVHHWASFAQMEARYVWDDQGTVTVNNADGSQEVYVHDPNARLVRQIGLDGGERHKAYDNLGRLIFEQDALGAVTQYHYDEAGRLITRLAPDETPTSYKYRHGFLHTRTRGRATWSCQRNAQGDITTVIDPEGQITHYSYDSLGRLLTIRFPDQSIQRFAWNALGQLLEETLPDGSQRMFSYDALGRRMTGQDEHGAITRYEWDAVGRLNRTTLPMGACRAWRYNAYGRITAETDELGRVTRYEYADDLHLISRRINPDGSTLKYRYDHAQLLLTEIENEGGRHLPSGLHAGRIDPTGNRLRWTSYRLQLRPQWPIAEENRVWRRRLAAGHRLSA
ncbi:UNVERIFIED_ORG: YD repeat-containing protein [Pseudomonas reinekei]|nr:YD repeat-containing protein [Pseudomonas reinekei]